MRKDFLWGGAVAAHQVEGGYNEKGKGLNVSDMMTVGGVGKKRQITDTILPTFYPTLLNTLLLEGKSAST